VFPAVSNTQGGPVHNPKQQIVDTTNTPIARLYAAGELGSSFGHLYLSGGNIAECFVTGRIAGREAAALEPWSTKAPETRPARPHIRLNPIESR
jgi:succinate dehydrogenase/fumarate reductase flavoprotein subunit